ncbi:2-phosphosulfolactate phosphatase [Patescibacteria group bacterium]|nr:2-phosphosulfolactate phosphatase [Patescibacteria group bacterium]
MNIKKHSTAKGSQRATGIVVIIDVLRACTTIPILLKNGADTIIPVKTIDDAQKYLNRGYVLIGEGKNGCIHDSFHYCNSPSEIHSIDFTEKNLVIRSNNATQAILNIEKATDIILASFVNLEAIVTYINDHYAKDVALVPLGRLNQEGLEDELCAEAIKLRLENTFFDFEKMKKEINDCPCAKLVRDTLDKPEDVAFALELNSYPIVPKVYTEDGQKVIKNASLND